jgi:hypothetical protein
MVLLSFQLYELFILLVPELEGLVGGVSFPDEPDFVQKYLSVWSQYVVCMKSHSLVLLVLEWHDTMALLSWKLDQLFMLLVPEHREKYTRLDGNNVWVDTAMAPPLYLECIGRHGTKYCMPQYLKS